MSSNESKSTGRVRAGQPVQHGTGVHSNRAFPTNAYPSNLDPFVLFERFYIDPDQGFPMHPHRGFEIVSYMLDGGMEHEDSLGVTNTAEAGEAMRITAGEGIRHSEFPAGGAACTGLQLWVNLPREAKGVDPDYEDASAAELPTERLDGATVTTVVGDGSPISLRTPMEYLDVAVAGADADPWTWNRRLVGIPLRRLRFGHGRRRGIRFGGTPRRGRRVADHRRRTDRTLRWRRRRRRQRERKRLASRRRRGGTARRTDPAARPVRVVVELPTYFTKW